jgi:hypothetical protein
VDDRTNLFVAKLQGVANRNPLYLCNLWLNPFWFLGLPVQGDGAEAVPISSGRSGPSLLTVRNRGAPGDR